MIKAKNKICIVCGRYDQPWFSKKRCRSCATIQDSKPIKSAPKKQTENKEELDAYFDFHIKSCSHSEESGKEILYPSRVNICHLFSKRQHPSIKANLANVVYLTWQEHNDFDRLLDSGDFRLLESKFKSWPKICKRMEKLLDDCLEMTKFRINFEKYLKEKQNEEK